MKLLLIFYIGFTFGLCIMDYLDVRNNVDFHMYKKSVLNIILVTLLSPFIFPLYIINNLIDVFKVR